MMMMMEQMKGDGNRERDLEGCHGYNRRHVPFTANQHRNTEPVVMDRVFGYFTVKIDKCGRFSDI